MITQNIVRDQEYHEKILTHLDKLKKSLIEKKILSFWCFPDKEKFAKLIKSRDEIIKAVKNNKKYHDRQIAEINICFMHDNEGHSLRELGVYITSKVVIYYIDEEGNMKQKWSYTIHWEEEDFQVSKWSLKLLEKILYLTADETLKNAGPYGFSLRGVIKKLNKKNIDISDVLKPL